MGIMVDGRYFIDEPPQSLHADDGSFRRAASAVRSWVTPDGAPGPTGEGGFPAEPGRYHIYAAWSCPWAHRTLLARLFKNLEGAIDVSLALPKRSDQGWIFEPDGEYSDRLYGASALHQIYARGVEGYSGRVTVPLLWDKETGRAVNNESADIVRMLDAAFGSVSESEITLRPPHLAKAIDAWNDMIYRSINNGVYRAGFARSQDAYEEAVYEVFEALDAINARLSESRYLAGDQFTEADLRLFPTLVRFDVAYVSAFKCNIRRLADYAYLWPYAREIYQMPGVRETVHFDIYKRGYHSLSEARNPLGIVPVGPLGIDWDEPHRRG